MRRLAIILLLALLVSAAANVVQWRMAHGEADHGADTIRITDTIRVVQPVVRDSIIVRTVTRTLMVSDTVRVHLRDTVVDSIAVEVPITQKVYQDSGYIAWVSGYEPRLDSLEVYHRETIIKPGRRRWSIGIQAGYGVTGAGLGPYTGIGITYNLTK